MRTRRSTQYSSTAARLLTGAGGAVLFVLATSVAAQAQSSDESGLAGRVEQLEQQLVEMQVTIGTLQSLAQGRPAAGAGYQAPANGGGNADVRQMEIQIRAMSGQIAALSRQVRALQGGGGAAAGLGSTGGLTNNSYSRPVDVTPGNDNGAATGGFGTVTVTNEQPQPESSDPIGNILSGELPGIEDEQQVAAVEPVSPRAAYDKAYGYLLEQDYGAAETAFGDFIKKHPNDKLAGNAQYWLGESHYVRGSYRAAANAFLKGYKTYGKSPKAPDSLLKLAMSLSRLGQKPSACATLKELQRRFPQAPKHVRRRSDAERQRAGC
ncbi:MAG: tol-pal system protein YbgF [Hyphomicrobiaceae bacterium]